MHQPTLYDVVADANLFAAWEKVKHNKGCAGVDGVSIGMFSQKLLRHLATLRDDVLHGMYRPLPLRRIDIPKESGGVRSLSVPCMRDRVLQTAVCFCITPILEAEFEECSFAYRAGRSVKQAVAHVEQLRDEGYSWVVDADIEAFFDSIDHGLLMDELSRLISDAGICKLIRLWLKNEIASVDGNLKPKMGVPQGSPISPLLSNLYLDRMDDVLLKSEFRLVRFADDFLVLCKDAAKAEAALQLTEEVLNDLQLSLNQEKTRLVDFNTGFRFLGVQFVRSLALKSKEHKKRSIHREENSEIAHDEQEPELLRYFQGKPSSDVMRMAFFEADLDASDFNSHIKEDSVKEPEVAKLQEEVVTVDHDPCLRTLYLTQHDYELAKSGERLVVQRNDEALKSIPSIKVDQVMIFGNAQITTPAMHYCLIERIPIYLLSMRGQYRGVIDAFDTDPVLLHRDQFKRAEDDSFALQLAKSFVLGKLKNSRLILKRQARNRDNETLQKNIQALDAIKPGKAETLDQLRGYEGAAAKLYFSALSSLIDKAWGFEKRVKQPPTDPINAMLSYGYTILFANVQTLLRARGLNPHVGYLHPMRPGHPALASDVMEEFRAIVVDAVILKLVLNEKLTPDDFQRPKVKGDACWLSPQARTIFIKAIETKLNSALTHPHSGMNIDYRRCIEQQIHQLASVIRGRQVEYQAMVLR